MNLILKSLLANFCLLMAITVHAAQKSDTFTTPTGKNVTITHIKHATMMIEYDGRYIFVDPVTRLKPETDFSTFPRADVLIVTHEHLDHFDPLAIGQLGNNHTVYCLNSSTYFHTQKGALLKNGDSLKVASDIWVWAVPANNTTPDHLNFHPKGRDNGYVLDIDGLRIYIAGDTEDIPEMADLKNIDIAFLPCNQPYTMTIDQLVRAAKIIKPKVFFPYHYGDTPVNQLMFRLAGTGIEVRIRDYK